MTLDVNNTRRDHVSAVSLTFVGAISATPLIGVSWPIAAAASVGFIFGLVLDHLDYKYNSKKRSEKLIASVAAFTTSQLKVAELAEKQSIRLQNLEDAFRILQESTAGQTHPIMVAVHDLTQAALRDAQIS